MLLKSNGALNQLQKHIQSMMKVSAPYGKKMGAMGTSPFNSGAGATFANKTAQMMTERPEATGSILKSIMNKAQGAGMSEPHMARMEEMANRVRSEVGGMERGGARTLRSVIRD